MKFRMFTEAVGGKKVAVNVESVCAVYEFDEGGQQRGVERAHAQIVIRDGARHGETIWVAEDFDTVFSRLNTIAE